VADLVGPLPGPFTGGLRVRAGLANRRAPGQARYYLDGIGAARELLSRFAEV